MVFLAIQLQPDLLDVWTETQDANQWQTKALSLFQITEAKHVGVGGNEWWTQSISSSSSSSSSSAAAAAAAAASENNKLPHFSILNMFFGLENLVFFLFFFIWWELTSQQLFSRQMFLASSFRPVLCITGTFQPVQNLFSVVPAVQSPSHLENPSCKSARPAGS